MPIAIGIKTVISVRPRNTFKSVNTNTNFGVNKTINIRDTILALRNVIAYFSLYPLQLDYIPIGIPNAVLSSE